MNYEKFIVDNSAEPVHFLIGSHANGEYTLLISFSRLNSESSLFCIDDTWSVAEDSISISVQDNLHLINVINTPGDSIFKTYSYYEKTPVSMNSIINLGLALNGNCVLEGDFDVQ